MFTPKGNLLFTQGLATRMVGGVRQFEGNSLRMGGESVLVYPRF
jgi:hypothetical protein